jgi:serine/threonine protein kinase
MIPKERQAAQMLERRKVGDGWRIIKKIEKLPHNTGGVYSCCYEVENEGRRGFLKAFDYSSADKVGRDGPEQMRDILDAYLYETEILTICTDSGCKNVIRLLDQGNLDIAEAQQYPRVEYLILEYAGKGDIRDALKDKQLTLEWKMRSLHQLANGLRQIHSLSIAHQDIKPSNLVNLTNGATKITDFGSAVLLNNSIRDIPKLLQKNYCGTWEYAPPELLYGEINNNSIIRRIGCDLYLLGSMVAFYFTNMSMTSLIKLIGLSI